MNHSFTPNTNFTNELKRSSLDNSPAYFTGCVECIKIVSRIPLLCSKCVNISEQLFTAESLVNGLVSKSDADEQKCNNHSFILDLEKTHPPELNNNEQVSDYKLSISEKVTSNNITIKRTLLPSPSSSKMSDNFYKKKRISVATPEKYEFNENLKKNHNKDENIQIITTITNCVGHKRKSEIYDEDHAAKKRFRRPSVIQCFQPSEDELSRSVWKLFLDYKQSEETYIKKMTLRDQLHNILLTRFPNCGLYVVGSSMSGLGANSSDMDMCLMLTDSEIDQEREAANILQIVHDLFIQYDFLLDVEVIYAKVPILRFKDVVSGIEVDLNINNAVGIRNTQLLTSYARVDERFPPLVLLAKLWARFHGINDAKNNTLSSYSLVLMVVHYLQYECNPSVLPCLQILQPDKFNPNSDVRKLKLHEDLPNYHSENKDDLGSLFLGFLKYFSYFRFQDNVMSVRLGNVLSKQTAMFTSSPKNKKGHWKFVCIEEPFDLTNTARAVFKPDAFFYLKKIFEKSWHRLRKTSDLDSILKG